MALHPPPVPAAPAVPAALAVLVLLLSTPGAVADPFAAPADRVDPAAIVAATETHRATLENLSTVEDRETAMRLVAAGEDDAHEVLDAVLDLDARDGGLLADYWGSLRTAADAGNLSDVRSLARAARGLVDDEVLPQVRAWSVNGTYLTPGNGQATAEGRTRVPVLLFHPPPGGVGAFDVEVQVEAGEVRIVEARAAVGTGEATVDGANGTARVASFDAKALGNLDAGGDFVTLAHVVLEPRSEGEDLPAVVDIDLRELADPDGRSVPAVTSSGHVVLGDDVGASTSPTVAVALVIVALLGITLAWTARRFLEV